MPKRKTQSEIINEFISIHGKRYDYSLVNYISSKLEVEVICIVHGKFNITPHHHKNGVGCNKCYFDSQKISKQEFIVRSKKQWGNIYDYSLFGDMPAAGEKVQIKCTLHNEIYFQEPKNHMKGHTGCPKCISLKLSGSRESIGIIKSQNQLNKEFINRVLEVHGGLYDYGRFIYINNSTDGEIICPIHGSFLQTPGNHLKGTKCPDCSKEALMKNTFKSICHDKGIDYARALKRRQAGLSEEKIFDEGYIRHSRKTKPVIIKDVIYPNLMEAIRAQKPKPVASAKTIARRIKIGFLAEEAFEYIPNPGYRNGIIYLISHLDSDKKYVGLTIQTLEKRWLQHKEDALYYFIKSEESLHSAIREFGQELFNIQIIDRGTTKIDLEEKEKEWIKKLESLIPNGYNISKGGGSGGSNPTPTPIDGVIYPSRYKAAEHVAKTENISLAAAKKRISNNRIHIKTPAKPGESIVKTKAYKAWDRIIHAVINPNSKDFIQSITVYKKWYDSREFIKDVGEPLQKNMAFTRLDKEKGFYPENCVWLTKSESSKLNAENMKKTGRLVGRKGK